MRLFSAVCPGLLLLVGKATTVRSCCPPQARQAGKGSEESAEAVSMLLNSLNQRAWDVTRSFRNSTAGHDAATAIVTVVSEGQLGEGLYAALQELSRSDE